MWQRFHILSRAQVFVVASICAVVIAFAVALVSIPADGVSWNRFLGPSRQLDPFINFGAVFVSMLPLFIGYYHLARLGALLGVAVSAVTFFATQVCAGFIFTFQVVGRSLVSQEAAYVSVWLILSMFFLRVHIKASNSPAVRNAQRLLHLTDVQNPELGQAFQGQ
jgi:hypothetical protein